MSWRLDEELGGADEAPGPAVAIAESLRDVSLVRRIFYFPEIDSTQQWLMHLAESSASSRGLHGVLVVADYQSAGRGRFGRPWMAPPNRALLFSLGLVENSREARFSSEEGEQGIVAAMLAMVPVAVCEAIRERTGLAAAVKFPNDVVVEGRKCAGVVAERCVRFPSVVVVGVGINVNIDREELPPTTHVPATSLSVEGGRHYDRLELLQAVLTRLDWWWHRSSMQELVGKLNEMCTTVGRRVCVHTLSATVEGVALGISERGGLLVRTEQGISKEIFSGDVVELDMAPTRCEGRIANATGERDEA